MEFALSTDRQIYIHLTLTVILVILNFCYNLHTTSNYCSKYEQPLSKNEKGVCVRRHTTDRLQVYLTISFDSKVESMIRLRPIIKFTHNCQLLSQI